MEEYKRLSENHRRVISSALSTIESQIAEIEDILLNPKNGIFHDMRINISGEETERILRIIPPAREILLRLREKYHLHRQMRDQKRIVIVNGIFMRDLMHDLTPEGLAGYGKFNTESDREWRSDVGQLINLIDKI